MNKSSLTLTAAALLASAGGAASAATIKFTRTSGPTLKPFTTTQTFPSFGQLLAGGTVPAGATLTMVTDTLTDTLAGSITITNLSGNSGSFTAAALDVATKTLPGLTITTTVTGNTVSGTLAGGATAGPSASSGSGSNSGSTTTVSGYLGTMPITAMIDDTINTTSNINFSNSLTTTGDGTVTDVLTYTYNTTVRTPEPATLSLLGVGLAGLGLARRRRRRK
jgi:hypothetical protein